MSLVVYHINIWHHVQFAYFAIIPHLSVDSRYRVNIKSHIRKLYLAFPKCGTLSHKLTWSHYYEILKCEDTLEMQFYIYPNGKNCKRS